MPRVQATPQSIDYEIAPQSNLLQYVDHGGYKTELGSEVEVSASLGSAVAISSVLPLRLERQESDDPHVALSVHVTLTVLCTTY